MSKKLFDGFYIEKVPHVNPDGVEKCYYKVGTFTVVDGVELFHESRDTSAETLERAIEEGERLTRRRRT